MLLLLNVTLTVLHCLSFVPTMLRKFLILPAMQVQGSTASTSY